jgi:hypothetical protein
MRFGDWLDKEFVAWRGDTRRTLTDFAAWIGIERSYLSRYINNPDIVPDIKTVQIIEKKLPSIHALLFTASPKVPPDIAETVKQAIVEAFTECERQNITPTSPEGEKLMSDVLSKHGIHTKSKT